MNGVIYAILSCNPTTSGMWDMYIGSTIHLKSRISQHISDAYYNRKTACCSKEILLSGPCYAIVLLDYPCDSRRALLAKETEVAASFNRSCNKVRASTRLPKESYVYWWNNRYRDIGICDDEITYTDIKKRVNHLKQSPRLKYRIICKTDVFGETIWAVGSALTPRYMVQSGEDIVEFVP